MAEATYTVILTESERTAMAKVLGGLVTKLINAPIFVETEVVCDQVSTPHSYESCVLNHQRKSHESPSGGTQSARAVLSPPPESPAAARPSPPTPVDMRDRWARDRKGKEVPNPEGCVSRCVKIWKVEQIKPKAAGKKEFMKVTWPSQEHGFVDANCFDAQLFPWLIKAQASIEKSTLYLVKSGEYLNVVGVRA